MQFQINSETIFWGLEDGNHSGHNSNEIDIRLELTEGKLRDSKTGKLFEVFSEMKEELSSSYIRMNLPQG
jgi:hypothetical protein